MKLAVQQKDFAAALSAAAHVVNSRTTLPVLANLLLEAVGSQLRVTGTNLDTSVVRTLPARIVSEGSVTLPAKLLTEYVGQLNDSATVDLTLDEKTCKVRLESGRYKANVSGIAAEDFPPVQDASGTAQRMPAPVFKKAVAEVIFAAAPDDTRPVLAGVQVSAKGGELTLVAADGFRLAVSHFPTAVGDDWSVIVPAKALAEVARLVPDAEDTTVAIQIAAKGNYVHFAFDDTAITSRLIQGEFPDYNRIIPSQSTSEVSVSRASFLQAARVASVFSKDTSDIVRLAASKSVDELRVSSTSAQSGDTETTLVAKVAADAEVALNARYLKEALGAMDTTNVTLALNGPSSPVVLRPEGESGYLVVIMPMHVAKGSAE